MARTMFHVTDEANQESIQSEGLLAGDVKNLVFLATSEEEARHIGEIYPTVDEPVVFKVDVSDRNLMDDPEPYGDLNSFAHCGDIPAHNVEMV